MYDNSIFMYLLDTIFQDVLLEEATRDSMETYQTELLRQNKSIILGKEYKHRLYNPNKHRNSKCFICLEDFSIREKILQLDCLHLFHDECIKKAIQFNPICPLCKKNIVVNDTSSHTE